MLILTSLTFQDWHVLSFFIQLVLLVFRIISDFGMKPGLFEYYETLDLT